ncbi:hypothetical protein [Catenovulum maritimum]|uniref:hypothetical protein n=1 Tax=Catenovulum maritimum TaxID=1513271 RepID=UPI00122E92B3|nr:hypothetical protein [Catenovulum maritimum]
MKKICLVLACSFIPINLASTKELAPIYIQAAACKQKKCFNTYRNLLFSIHQTANIKYTAKLKNKFSITSSIVSDRKALEALRQKINSDLKIQVTASLIDLSGQYYLDLGTQPNETQASWLVKYANYIARGLNINFKSNNAMKKESLILVLAGPYKDLAIAQENLAIIKSIPEFKSAFILN